MGEMIEVDEYHFAEICEDLDYYKSKYEREYEITKHYKMLWDNREKPYLLECNPLVQLPKPEYEALLWELEYLRNYKNQGNKE